MGILEFIVLRDFYFYISVEKEQKKMEILATLRDCGLNAIKN